MFVDQVGVGVVQEGTAKMRVFAAIDGGGRGHRGTKQVWTHRNSDRRKRGRVNQVGHVVGGNRRGIVCREPERGNLII